MSREITITLTGPRAEGKSILANAIAGLLTAHGSTVISPRKTGFPNLSPVDLSDFPEPFTVTINEIATDGPMQLPDAREAREIAVGISAPDLLALATKKILTASGTGQHRAYIKSAEVRGIRNWSGAQDLSVIGMTAGALRQAGYAVKKTEIDSDAALLIEWKDDLPKVDTTEADKLSAALARVRRAPRA